MSKCPKCEREMELGFVANATFGGHVVSTWYSGPFKPSFWRGLGLRKRKAFYVRTLRCTNCGYLESYAR